ncbi:uncharacterized protein LOC128548760 [Mercenaria mercenaria]|uniref:uncharacterized protein LOC128548760 n=1 Tax=Mercenaria mercenaria TaxID=6596 RepID=UPI00234F173F|nr:uncharacterized protein LOC128548760 [Mercenaria mercenaria]
MNDQLIEVIRQCELMLTPQVFTNNEEKAVSVEGMQDGNGGVTEETSNVYENERLQSNKGKNKGKGKGKGKGNGKVKSSSARGKGKKRKAEDVEEKTEDDNCCSICNGQYDESPKWICCDGCDKWYHGQCVGINTPAEWEKYADESVKFICPFC